MTTDELLELFRAEIDDKETPYLWSDTEIYGYMDDAQKTFCRKTEGIEDARTASVCQLSVVPGTEWYAKSPLIRKVRSCSRADTGKIVNVLTPENPAGATLEFRASNTGPVKALVDGQSKGFFRIYPMPSETVTLNLTVFRLPLVAINDNGGQQFEIDDEHVPYLMDWMKYRAYRKHDADTFDARASADGFAAFNAYCAQAKTEQGRIRRQTGVTVYGGLPMASSGNGTDDYFNRW